MYLNKLPSNTIGITYYRKGKCRQNVGCGVEVNVDKLEYIRVYIGRQHQDLVLDIEENQHTGKDMCI